MKKNILGLDLGTNSIGWALVEQDFENKEGKILGMGSRIIPMSQDIKDEFGKGNSVSQTAERTNFRGIRRLRERNLLRRERLHRVLNVLGFLPEHYLNEIDFSKRLGKFKENTEPKLAYCESGFLFQNSFLEMLNDFNGEKIPYDWTIYYLRKKALTQKLEKEELAWIILNFNQKRGYYQLRGEEEEENPNKLEEFHSLKIVDVIPDAGTNKKGETWYSLILENGWVYRRSSKIDLSDWKDKVKDFIVTTDLNDDGTVKRDKDGVEKRSFRAPKEDDWTLLKKKTEQEIFKSNKTVGAFIYDSLVSSPKQKIRGKLVRTIERKFYKEELIAILKKQIELQPNLFTDDLLNACIYELYRNNEAQQQILIGKDFVHLFVNDIIFYQRPLRSQKSSIGNCVLEFRTFKSKDKNGQEIIKKEYLKAIPKSHPLYQEFRVWQWMFNLRIYKKLDDTDVTIEFISTTKDWENLFSFLMTQKEVDHKSILKFLLKDSEFKGKALNAEMDKYRWNYVFDELKNESKNYPMNETCYEIRRRLNKVENIPENFLTYDVEYRLWHLIYSVTDKLEYEKALVSFAKRYSLPIDSFVENFRKFPPFKSEYGSFSEKAIKKLLPLMRLGSYWSWTDIEEATRSRIEKIITGEVDAEIKNRVREKAIHLQKEEDFQGLQLWLAQYIVYGRHSEADDIVKWDTVEDLNLFLKEFRQHSLRNPIVEQVVTETLRVVKDIWIQFGKGENDFFNEIHIELGREMKNTAEERKRLTNMVTENEITNQRIKYFLAELVKDPSVENVRPHSPMQQDILKIYEDGIINSGIEIPEEIAKISRSAQPTSSEFQRYKLWLEQKYKSPYTGQVIPLNKLFTTEYEIEHIIPQSRYFDDSFSNKVICESAVNKQKDKQLGLEFIKNHQGSTIELGGGKSVKILSESAYHEFVKENYKNNRSKRMKLLLDEVPEQMINRQLNDTRYISKFISTVLSRIVREQANDEGFNSKNVLPGNGKITSRLKQDWGLNDVWNELILPRFIRMNQLTKSKAFTSWSENHQKYLPTVPLDLARGFQKKRIDHRHHAMDALVIACATRDHINLLNNQSAKSETSRFDLQNKLRVKETYVDQNLNKEKIKYGDFYKPWKTFTEDARNGLEGIVASFKQNLRVINKTTNKYEKYVIENGKKIKKHVRQTKGDSWAIRKPMHKDTVSGAIRLRKKKYVSLNAALETPNEIVDVNLRKQIRKMIGEKNNTKMLKKFFNDQKNQWNGNDVSRVEIFYWDNENVASRVNLDVSFNEKRITETIADTGIQKILLSHIEKYKGRLDEKGKEIPAEHLAFTPEGIDEMNKNILSLNDGKKHKPIYKVRTYEPKGNKFQVGQKGNKQSKYVEAAKGTNLFFGIYVDENGKRSYDTIPLNIVIERQKQGLSSVPETNSNGEKLLFHLSPNDLVYIPEEGENARQKIFFDKDSEHIHKIYKIVSFTGSRLSAIPVNVSSVIVNKVEYTQLNKIELTKEKESMFKIKIDRLGIITNN